MREALKAKYELQERAEDLARGILKATYSHEEYLKTHGRYVGLMEAIEVLDGIMEEGKKGDET